VPIRKDAENQAKVLKILGLTAEGCPLARQALSENEHFVPAFQRFFIPALFLADSIMVA